MPTRIIRENPPEESKVMFESYPAVVKKVRAAPNVWFLVAAGTADRRRVFSQTAHQIRRGRLAPFRLDEDDKGAYEVRVTTETDPTNPDDNATTKMYLRWVSATKE